MKGSKGQLTLSGFLIGLIVVSMFIITVFGIIGVLSQHYGEDYSDENQEMISRTQGHLAQLQEQTNQIGAGLEKNTSSSNVLDLLGGVFQSGLQTAKLTFTSAEIAVDVVDTGFQSVKASDIDTGDDDIDLIGSLRASVIAIISILFFVTIFLYIVLGRNT